MPIYYISSSWITAHAAFVREREHRHFEGSTSGAEAGTREYRRIKERACRDIPVSVSLSGGAASGNLNSPHRCFEPASSPEWLILAPKGLNPPAGGSPSNEAQDIRTC